MMKTRKLALAAFDVFRGLILGALICFGIVRIALLDPNDVIFRYAGY